jgi:hypothetical protein
MVERNGSNPRRIKRFINTLILERLDPLALGLSPQLLIRYLLIEMYVSEFARALETPGPGGVDAIEEFLTYSRGRGELEHGTQGEWARKALRLYAVESSSNPGEDLQRLDQATRAAFVSLTRNDDFVALVASVSADSDRKAILDKAQRRLALQGFMLRGVTGEKIELRSPTSRRLRTVLLREAPRLAYGRGSSGAAASA